MCKLEMPAMYGSGRYGRKRSRSRTKTTKSGFSKRRRMPVRRVKSRLAKFNLHAYKRWATGDEVTTASASVSSTKVFQLSDTINSSELTALYDQYQIVGVKIRIQLINSPDAAYIPGSNVLNTTNWYPKIWYAPDYDNNAAETVADLKQRNNVKCKILRPNSFVSIYVRPAVLNTIDVGDTTTTTAPIWNQWLDCSNSQVRHYGMKYAFDNSYSQVQTWRYRLDYCYYLKFKNAR